MWLVKQSRKIVLGNKYLLEGDTVIYYQNLTQLIIDYNKGLLKLSTPSKSILINRENFPTESKKEHKIKISQDKKFRKISQRVYDLVKKSNPLTKIKTIKKEY